MLKPKDLSRVFSPRRCVVIIYKIRCKLKLVKVKMWHFVYVNIFCTICMHGFEKNRLRQNYVGLILILYFDEDQRSLYDCSWILENIGSVFVYIQVILYFGIDHRAVVMLPDFR